MYKMAVWKGLKRRCCTYPWPVSLPCLWTSWYPSLGVALPEFFSNLFLLFLFSSVLFLCDSQSQTHYLSSIVSLDTFAHAHTPELPASPKKFGTIHHPSITDLVRLQQPARSLSCQIFRDQWARDGAIRDLRVHEEPETLIIMKQSRASKAPGLCALNEDALITVRVNDYCKTFSLNVLCGLIEIWLSLWIFEIIEKRREKLSLLPSSFSPWAVGTGAARMFFFLAALTIINLWSSPWIVQHAHRTYIHRIHFIFWNQ